MNGVRSALYSLWLSYALMVMVPAVMGEEVNADVRALQEDPAVTRLREYLRLKAVHPNPDYNSSIAWIKNQAKEIGLDYNIKEFAPPGLFAIWLCWKGTNQSLPSILLNSHIDVVPVDEAKWTHPPFGAEKDKSGNIFARGAQDMKGIGALNLEAVRNLKSRGMKPLRNVFISFVPDEEVGGVNGMKLFSTSEEFKKLNVGLGLDEGIVENDDKLRVVWSERAIVEFEFRAIGKSGHGSIFHENTAAEKIQRIINAMLELRTKEKLRMETNNLSLGDVTTINLTIMKGGTQVNVVPTELSVTFDMRVTPHWNLTSVFEFLEEVRVSAGPNVTLTYLEKAEASYKTPLTPDNVWWNVFQTTAKNLGRQLIPVIHNAATDARYLRKIGVPAFGFTALTNTPLLIHDNDEFINENRFLEAIKTLEQFLPNLFNLGPNNGRQAGTVQPKEMQTNLHSSPKLLKQINSNTLYAGQRPRDMLRRFRLSYNDN